MVGSKAPSVSCARGLRDGKRVEEHRTYGKGRAARRPTRGAGFGRRLPIREGGLERVDQGESAARGLDRRRLVGRPHHDARDGSHRTAEVGSLGKPPRGPPGSPRWRIRTRASLRP
jgi:hypothetical protein